MGMDEWLGFDTWYAANNLGSGKRRKRRPHNRYGSRQAQW